jgi:hypothetical protein
VNSTYSRVGLKHIGVNVDSKDNEPPRPTSQVVMRTLDTYPVYSCSHRSACRIRLMRDGYRWRFGFHRTRSAGQNR